MAISIVRNAETGEEVVITRHGQPVAEPGAARKVDRRAAVSAKARLRARRNAGKALPVTSVELLRQVYEDQ